ncbi:MAG: rhodanese-like domain-containing protein [Alphaproteobacteria bacterium]|nr:rhodanese-like domain-containing protein [Alphaproteobacteria bacterium]
MKTVSYQELKDLKNRNAVTLVNVLPKEYFEKTHIPGSINIPHEEAGFESRVERVIGSKDMPIVVYCANKECDASRKAADKLANDGFTNVMCYEGGAQEWERKSKQSAAA